MAAPAGSPLQVFTIRSRETHAADLACSSIRAIPRSAVRQQEERTLRTPRRLGAFAFLAAMLVAGGGCLDFMASPPDLTRTSDDVGDDGGGDLGPPPGSVSIEFRHVVGPAELASSPAVRNVSAAGEQFFSSLFRYVASEFALEGSAGTGDFHADVVHLVDAFTAETRTLTLRDVPAGTYARLRFRLGLSAAGQQRALGPAFDSMRWPGGGYGYFEHNGLTMPMFASFDVRGGPTGGEDRSFEVTLDLPAPLTVTDSTSPRIGVTMDVGKWYDTPNRLALADLALVTTETDSTIQRQLMENGATAAFSLTP